MRTAEWAKFSRLDSGIATISMQQDFSRQRRTIGLVSISLFSCFQLTCTSTTTYDNNNASHFVL